MSTAREGTQSEPRRTIYTCGCTLSGTEDSSTEADRHHQPLTCPVHRAIWQDKRAVGSGHDEQTEGHWAHQCDRLERRGDVLRDALMQWKCEKCDGSGQKNDWGGEVESGPCPRCHGDRLEPRARQALDDAALLRSPEPWQPDERTVAAVVEALREQASRADDSVLGRAGHVGVYEWERVAGWIEERFKPSAPGGDRG